MSAADGVKKNKGGLLAWGGLAAIVALIVLFGALKKPPEETAVEPEKPVAVRTLAIEPRTVADALQLPARIEPLQEAHLAAERAGRVMELLVARGQAVEAGQVLLRLDGRLRAAAVRRAAIETRDSGRDLKC